MKNVLFRHEEAEIEVYVENGIIYFMNGSDGYYGEDNPNRRASLRAEAKRLIQKHYEEVINRAFEQEA